MKEKFLKAIEIFKEKTIKECYKVSYEEREVGILDDKLGGMPYLPINEEYPVTSKGKPMGLLLQVNLKNIDLEGYPKKGILEIFIDSEFEWPLEYQIKVFEEGLEYQTELENIDYNYFPVSTPLAITLSKDICQMPISDYRFSVLFLEIVNEFCGIEVDSVWDLEDEVDFDWYDLVYQNIVSHPITIGGYADFTQTDPRDGEIEGYEECLFKLDGGSDYKHFCVGDSGIIFTLISKENIVNNHFEEAKVDWDCC